MKKQNDYILPDHKAAAQRTKEAVEPEYGLFSLNSECEALGEGKKYFIRTYGCQANVRDGETIAGMMEVMNFTPCTDPKEADVLIFNTCAVRRAAEEHVLGEIGMLKGLKKENPDRIFCVCGCMAQEEAVVQEILKYYPQVDLIFGTHNLYRLPDLLKKVMQTKSAEKRSSFFNAL